MNFSLLVVSYLFLAGAGAGASLITCCLHLWDLRRVERTGAGGTLVRRRLVASRRNVYGRMMFAALAFLVLGTTCLVFDLARPHLVGLLFFRPTKSFLTFGSFSLAILIASVACLAFEGVGDSIRLGDSIRKVILVICLAASLCVILYTGLFLYSIYTVRAWHSLLVPALFLFSSLSTGIALIYVAIPEYETSWLDGVAESSFPVASMAIIAGEALLTCLYATYLVRNCPPSAQALLAGDLSALFWGGYVLCGLALPLALNAFSWKYEKSLQAPLALMLCIGGIALRSCVVFAGFPA